MQHLNLLIGMKTFPEIDLEKSYLWYSVSVSSETIKQ